MRPQRPSKSTTRRIYGEVRWNAFGWIDALLYSLTIEEEGEHEVIRAISLRKATGQEQKKYARRY